MKVISEKKGNILVLDIHGKVVGDASLDLRRSINGWLAELPESDKPHVILDLGKVSVMDSAGLGVLVSSFASVQRKGGRLVLAGLGRGLQNLVAITKLTRVFDMYRDADEAAASFQ